MNADDNKQTWAAYEKAKMCLQPKIYIDLKLWFLPSSQSGCWRWTINKAELYRRIWWHQLWWWTLGKVHRTAGKTDSNAKEISWIFIGRTDVKLAQCWHWVSRSLRKKLKSWKNWTGGKGDRKVRCGWHQRLVRRETRQTLGVIKPGDAPSMGLQSRTPLRTEKQLN